ncbi:MAG: hypothetical protein FP819_03665 [Rhizobiaceae bacterium]|nr:hypothetical protein [Rhizobiaceae bacterium]
MAEVSRPILTLKSTEDGLGTLGDRTLELGVFDVLLPCRRFDIDHKVAVLGRVSLTTEFLLRLIKSADGISEEQAAAFFGFDQRDMAFVVSEAANLGYIERRDGRLWLTIEGSALFREGSSQPEIFEVEKRRLTVGFDLLSLSPQAPRFLEQFELRLPELEIVDQGLAANATESIPEAFRRNYLEVGGRDRSGATKRALYSIDEVTPETRFSSPVRIVLKSAASAPAVGEPGLDEWRPDYERDDRQAIVQAVALFVDSLKTSRRPDDQVAYDLLIQFAPEFLKDFTRRDGLATERYYREAVGRTGDLRSDRPTVPLVGSLFTRDNLKRVFEALSYGIKAGNFVPSCAIWTVPNVAHWGATRVLPDVLQQFRRQLAGDEGRSVSCYSMHNGRPGFHLTKAFDHSYVAERAAFPPPLEILLVPGIFAAVSVNVPVGLSVGHPVPLGLVTYDREVLARVAAFVSQKISAFGPDAAHLESSLAGREAALPIGTDTRGETS